MPKQARIVAVWEEDQSPDAADRLAAAFDMLFGKTYSANATEDTPLDSTPL